MSERSRPARWRLVTVLTVLTTLVVALAAGAMQRVAATTPAAEEAPDQQTAAVGTVIPLTQPAERVLPRTGSTSAELDFSTKPDGPAPSVWDTGQPTLSSHWAADPSADFVVRDGRLTNRPTIDGATAAYFSSSSLGGPVTEIGARFTFTPRGGSQGSLAIIVSTGTRPVIPQPTGPLSVHFVAVADEWNFGIGRDDHTPLEVLDQGRFTTPLKEDGQTVHQVVIDINGGRVILNLPDGTRRIINDRRIGMWAGSYPTFELYSRSGLSDSIPGFEKIWARAADGPS